MRFVVRFVLALAAVNALCLATALAIYVGRYEEMMADLLKSRIMVTASATRGVIEAALDLGLKLSDAHDVSDLVVQIPKRYPQVTDVFVLNGSGIVLFASANEKVGTPSPDTSRLENISCIGSSLVAWSTPQFGNIALPLCNSFNVRSGALIMTYSRKGTRVRVEETAKILVEWAFVLLFCSGAIMTVATYVIFRPLTRVARQTAARLNTITDTWASEHFGDPPPDGWFGHDLAVFETKAIDALHTLNEAERCGGKASQ